MRWTACADLVRSGDPDRFLAAMTAPVEGRARLFPLYAFNLEVAKVPWVTSEPMLAEIRLQWWRDAVAEIYDGKAARRHEVVEPLAQAICAADLPRAPFDALVDARSYDIHGDPHPSHEHFTAYIAATAGGLGSLAAHALGAGEADIATTREASTAAGIGHLLAALRPLYAANAHPMYLEEPVEPAEILAGELPERLAAAIRTLAGDALIRLRAARRTGVARSITPALAHVWRAEATLKRAISDPAWLLKEPDPMSEARRRAGFAWRSLTARW